jgi:hypothetical protein
VVPVVPIPSGVTGGGDCPGTVLLSRGGFSVMAPHYTGFRNQYHPGQWSVSLSGVVVLLRRHLLNKGNLREVASEPREHEDSIVKIALGA